MKKVLLFAAVAAFAASFTSCKKCGTCVQNGVSGGEVCKKDAGDLGYNLAKDVCIAGGGTWDE